MNLLILTFFACFCIFPNLYAAQNHSCTHINDDSGVIIVNQTVPVYSPQQICWNFDNREDYTLQLRVESFFAKSHGSCYRSTSYWRTTSSDWRITDLDWRTWRTSYSDWRKAYSDESTSSSYWRTSTPNWWTSTPNWWTSSPNWWTSPSYWMTSTPNWWTSTPNWRTSTPNWWTSPPYSRTFTPNWWTSPYWRTSSNYGSTSSPYWRTSSNYGSTSRPYWRTSSNYGSTSPPYWRTSSNYGSTSPPYWRTSSNYGSTSPPYWRTSNYESTYSPYWRTSSNHGSTSPPYWRTSSNYGSTSPPYWRTSNYESTYSPYWRTSSNYWNASPYYWRTSSNYGSTSTPYWRTSSPYRWNTSPTYWRTTSDYWKISTVKDSQNVVLKIYDSGYDLPSKDIYPPYSTYEYTTFPNSTNIILEIGSGWNNYCEEHEIALKIDYFYSKKNVTDIKDIRGLQKVRKQLVNGISNGLSRPLKWSDDTGRLAIALYLGNNQSFSRISLIQQLITKQVDLKSSVALLRNNSDQVSLNKLAKIVHSLLVTCHNPKNFYGFNLLDMLKDGLNRGEPESLVSSPLAYLALCNANATLSTTAINKLMKAILRNAYSDYPFMSDIQALSVMALTCLRKQNPALYDPDNVYEKAIEELQEEQQADGSFGNVYTTAIITQALMSSDIKNKTSIMNDSVIPAIKFLVNHFNSPNASFVQHLYSQKFNFFAAYYTLPILNSKTLLDLQYVDCPNLRNKNGEDITEIGNRGGPKIQIQYSLVFGDKEHFSRTISFRVPDNTTVYEVMLIAQARDPNYKFEWKQKSGKMYIYQIANVPNDPEEGRFWLTYLKKDNVLEHTLQSPDKIYVREGYSLIQKYSTPSFLSDTI